MQAFTGHCIGGVAGHLKVISADFKSGILKPAGVRFIAVTAISDSVKGGEVK